jgi:hypothetical protein
MAKDMFAPPELVWRGREDEHRRKLAQSIRGLLNGKMNNVSEVTLVPDATQTVVTALNATANSEILLTPKSASAAAALSSLWVQPGNGEVTLNHDASPATDRVFGLAGFG